MKIVRKPLIAVGLIAALATLVVADLSSPKGGAAMAQDQALLPYKIVERRESGSSKISLIVEISLVGDRLPYERELRDLTSHLLSPEKNFARQFVRYYLPGMKQDEGAFAMGQYNPDPPGYKVFIRPYKLAPYPDYARFADEGR